MTYITPRAVPWGAKTMFFVLDSGVLELLTRVVFQSRNSILGCS